MTLKGKHIVLGITGSIAAYKACILIRGLIKAGAEVQVVITPAGKEFITPLTLSTLTSRQVISEFFDRRDGSWNSHVDLGLWADAMIIAPATASTIGKMANGIADNMLITTYLSMKAPIFLAPAMDLDMYKHPSTQNNISTLKSYGVNVIEACEGELASHLVGKGRMEEPENIITYVSQWFEKNSEPLSYPLQGKTVLITAGPTYEKIDPVRFIGNYSSGKMGYALAEECATRGAKVILVSGPVNLSISSTNISRISVESAAEMLAACKKHFAQSDVAIFCAAVADFTPESKDQNKIKREKGKQTIQLIPTTDIAAELGKIKKDRQITIGFALETDNEITNATEKLRKKNLDFIVLNSLQNPGAGFQHDTNQISIITQENRIDFPLKNKKEVAKDVIQTLCEKFLY